MPPDDRTYIKLHDGMPDHPKIDPLSDAAFRLLVSAWCWSSRHLTDGAMPSVTWAKRGTARARRELVDVGLVVEDDGRVLFHDYLEHQRSAAQVAAMKEQRREAGRRGGQARGKRVAKRVAKQTASELPGELPSETPSKTQAETESTSNEVLQTETDLVARKRATAPPDVFPITDEMRSWGREHAPHVADPAAETQQFLDYHRGKGSSQKDWPATWRTWMRNAEKYAVRDGVKLPSEDDGEWWMRRGGASA